jgi:hypothetical protein
MIIAHNEQNVGPVSSKRPTARRGEASDSHQAFINQTHHLKKLATKSHKESQKPFCDFSCLFVAI